MDQTKGVQSPLGVVGAPSFNQMPPSTRPFQVPNGKSYPRWTPLLNHRASVSPLEVSDPLPSPGPQPAEQLPPGHPHPPGLGGENGGEFNPHEAPKSIFDVLGPLITPTTGELEEGSRVEGQPPENFHMVAPNIYRGSYPARKNFNYLKQLGLRTIVFLCPEDYNSSNLAFFRQIGAKVMQFGTEGNKGERMIPEEIVHLALSVILDTRNHPVIIHCNKGKHRTGSVVGCLRKVMGWSLSSILHEYRQKAHPKAREEDQNFIEAYQPVVLITPHIPLWLKEIVDAQRSLPDDKEEISEVKKREKKFWNLLIEGAKKGMATGPNGFLDEEEALGSPMSGSSPMAPEVRAQILESSPWGLG